MEASKPQVKSVLSAVRDTVRTLPEPFTSAEVFMEIRPDFEEEPAPWLRVAVRNSIRYLRCQQRVVTVDTWRPRGAGTLYRRGPKA